MGLEKYYHGSAQSSACVVVAPRAVARTDTCHYSGHIENPQERATCKINFDYLIFGHIF
jgi:hypothetical protein